MRRIALLACSIGFVIVVLSWTSLQCVHHVIDAFATNSTVGWLTLSGITLVVIGLLYLIGHELNGYLQVRKVGQLAIAMQGDDINLLRTRAQYWLRSINDRDTIVAIQTESSVTAINQCLDRVFIRIDSKVDKIIATEAAITGTAVGISPWPLVDGGIVAWRQLRLIRRIANEYGLRPSTLGTMRLLRQIATAVVFADVSEHATQWLSSKVPSIGGLVPAAGQAVAIGVLTGRVGWACKKVCK
nr:DUF697 domain-containing protein [PVC group bacterium]